MALLKPTDLTPFADITSAKAQAMIDDAIALAEKVAPCITSQGFEHAAAAKAIIRGAVLRWNEQSSGAGPALMAGAFQMQPQNQPRRFLFFPSEINELSALCGRGRAFTVDTTPAPAIEVGS